MDDIALMNPGRVVYAVIQHLSKQYAQIYRLSGNEYLRLYGELGWFYWYYNYMQWGQNFKTPLSEYVRFYFALSLVCIDNAKAHIADKSKYSNRMNTLHHQDLYHQESTLIDSRVKNNSLLRDVRGKQEQMAAQSKSNTILLCFDYLQNYEDKLKCCEKLALMRSLRISLLYRLLRLLGINMGLPGALKKCFDDGYLQNESEQEQACLFVNAIEEKLFCAASECGLPMRALCDFFSRDYARVGMSFHAMLSEVERASLCALQNGMGAAGLCVAA